MTETPIYQVPPMPEINSFIDYCDQVSISPGVSSLSDDIYEEILRRLSAKPLIEYKCHNCGAPLEFEYNKPIVKCQYCGSAYAVSTNRINDKGD